MSTIPKSLHTVTALVNVARTVGKLDTHGARFAVQYAANILGYGSDHEDDPHGLIARAIAVLGGPFSHVDMVRVREYERAQPEVLRTAAAL